MDEKNEQEEIAKMLKTWINSKFSTVATAAEALDVPPGTLTNWISGRSTVPYYLIARLNALEPGPIFDFETLKSRYSGNMSDRQNKIVRNEIFGGNEILDLLEESYKIARQNHQGLSRKEIAQTFHDLVWNLAQVFKTEAARRYRIMEFKPLPPENCQWVLIGYTPFPAEEEPKVAIVINILKNRDLLEKSIKEYYGKLKLVGKVSEGEEIGQDMTEYITNNYKN